MLQQTMNSSKPVELDVVRDYDQSAAPELHVITQGTYLLLA